MNSANELKRILGFLTAAALAVGTTGCGNKTTDEVADDVSRAPVSDSAETTEPTAKPVSNSVRKAYSELFSQRDMAQECEKITADIVMSGDSAKCDDSGVSVDGSTVTITQEGIYRISGKLDGQVVVNAPKAKVQLVLDNAEINGGNSSAISAEDSDKLFVTTAKDSVNVLSSDASEAACLYSKDSITLNGMGRLSITSKNYDGIHSKDDIVITGGELNIDALADGIKGKDYVAVCGGELTIKSGEDGVKSTNAEDTAFGFVYIEGGNFAINSGMDGIQAETDIVVTGGEFDITSGGGAENSTKVHTDDFGGGFGGFGGFNKGDFDPNNMPSDFKKGDIPDNFDPNNIPDNFDFGGMTPPDGFDPSSMTPPDGFNKGDRQPMDAETGATPDNKSNTDDSSSDSQKGFKGIASIDISGGTVKINSSDDAFHSNGNVLISGGNIELCAGDDGIHADSKLEISGGETNIIKSYEGLEAAVINISGGVVELVAEDDGINASDGTSQGGMGTYSKGVELNISGGSVYVNAEGDGVDSNGDMTISGGTVLIDGPTIGANGALDSNSEIVVTGGLLIAAGSSGMAEYPGENSTQHSVSATFDKTQSANTLVTLLDSSGKEVLSYAPSKTFGNIVISTPDIAEGKTYTIIIGGSSDTENIHGLYEVGGYKNDGDEAGSFTADSPTSLIGKQSSMGGGFGGFGGGRDKFDKSDFQMPTDENGNPQRPEGGRGGKGSKPQGDKPTA